MLVLALWTRLARRKFALEIKKNLNILRKSKKSIKIYPCESHQTAQHRTLDSRNHATYCSTSQDCTNLLVEFDRLVATEKLDFQARILVN